MAIDPAPWAPTRPLTYDDLQRLPDDGHRYELLDGMLLVSPSPVVIHQLCLSNLARLLFGVLPPNLRLFTAPLDWKISESTVFEPDLLVVDQATVDVGAKALTSPPLLAVEILSPSSRQADRVLKAAAYADAGLAHYWIIDPQVPSVHVMRLVGGRYELIATGTDNATLPLHEPFVVTLTPRELVVL